MIPTQEILFSADRLTREISDGEALIGEITTFFIEDFKGKSDNACARIEITTSGATRTKAIRYQLGRHIKGWSDNPDTFEPLNPGAMEQFDQERFDLELLQIADRIELMLVAEGAHPDFSKGFKTGEVYLITEVSQ